MTFEELIALGGAWAWANYGKDIVAAIVKKLALRSGDKAKEAIEAGWNRVEWELAAKKYRENVQDLYGTVSILGKPKPVPLEGIFTDVLILDKPTAFSRFDINQLRSDPEQLESLFHRKNGLELVKEKTSDRLFILGRPGAGKTTFLKHLTIQATNGEINKIPIFVSFKEWDDSELELAPYLSKQFAICGFPEAQPFVEHILKKGDALVMFDGLDEVAQEGRRRDKLIADVRDFSNQYSKTQCIITCRIAATQYTFEKYTYFELANFTEKQILTFAKKWFAEERKKFKLFKEEFGRPENKGLRELGKVPLLLSLLCLSFEETLTFPQRRAEIYEEALDALLKKWDASRSIKRDEIYRGMTSGRKRQMLARIATKSFQMNEYFIPQAKLTKRITDYLRILPGINQKDEIDGEAVLKAIEAQHGILIERARHIYSFSHLSLQEHFTAKYICENASREVLSGLLRFSNIADPRWREVILLTASMLENADVFFELFQQSVNHLIANDQALHKIVKVLSKVTDSKTIMHRQMVGLLYYIVILQIRRLDIMARDRYGEYSLFDQTFDDICEDLEVEFPLPIFELAVIGDRGPRITNLEHIVGLIGPIIPPHIKSDLELDLKLIYMLLVSEHLKSLSQVDPEDLTLLNLEFLDYFDGVFELIIPHEDKRSINEWVNLKQYPSYISWGSIIDFILKVVLEYRSLAKEGTITAPQLTKLKHYIYCSDLLFECLDMAVVTDRKAIENYVYRLPRGFSSLRVLT
jgi:hypothetical protein